MNECVVRRDDRSGDRQGNRHTQSDPYARAPGVKRTSMGSDFFARFIAMPRERSTNIVTLHKQASNAGDISSAVLPATTRLKRDSTQTRERTSKREADLSRSEFWPAAFNTSAAHVFSEMSPAASIVLPKTSGGMFLTLSSPIISVSVSRTASTGCPSVSSNVPSRSKMHLACVKTTNHFFCFRTGMVSTICSTHPITASDSGPVPPRKQLNKRMVELVLKADQGRWCSSHASRVCALLRRRLNVETCFLESPPASPRLGRAMCRRPVTQDRRRSAELVPAFCPWRSLRYVLLPPKSGVSVSSVLFDAVFVSEKASHTTSVCV